MATFTKHLLSESTDGKNINIAATETPGDTVHTVPVGIDSVDEVWLYATNTSASPVDLTIEYGGVNDPDDLVPVRIPPRQGLFLLIPGLLLQNGVSVSGFASVPGAINISGFVNRVD